MASILDELRWRGLIADLTDAEGLAARLQDGAITLYCGFDPTADSLHVGHLVPLLALRRFQEYGHRPIALAGGATGLIGDPSGKSEERNLLTPDRLQANVDSIVPQLRQFLDFDREANPAQLQNNAEWMAPMSFLEFLREVGKRFSVNMMVAKESVRHRMQDRDAGISYTEFSYMLLQAYDFYALNQRANCELQIGGSDQWGNITAGIDLCRKSNSARVFGLTLPLIMNSDGTKFGKTAAGAIWLSAEKTSVYRFYQFWINVDDRDVIRYLKFFTFLDRETIETLEKEHANDPGKRVAHRELAQRMTELIHGKSASEEAQAASRALFGGSLDGIGEAGFRDLAQEVPCFDLEWPEGASDCGVIDLLMLSQLSSSKGQARKDIQGGGVYLNNHRVEDFNRRIDCGDLLFGRYLLVRKGKKNYALLQLVEDGRE